MATESAETRQKPEVLVDTAALSEAEWLAWRRQGIGGSDAAAILGISPWRTARDLYDDKLGSISAQDDSGIWVALEMGHLLEDLVARIFSKKTGYPVFQIKKMFRKFYCRNCLYTCSVCHHLRLGIPRRVSDRHGQSKNVCPDCYQSVVSVCRNCLIHENCQIISGNRFCPTAYEGFAA